MVRQAFAEVDGRHRMLEGFLLRLARRDDADAFVLRGGMLVRHWFPDARRPARDVDLVCALPFDAALVRDRLVAILSDASVHDGVAFDVDRLRLDTLFPESAHPGLRLFAVGLVDGFFAEMSVDLTFGLDVWPAARREVVPLSRGEACLRLCEPEMLIGRKLQVTGELGRRWWRAKDLGDVWWMLQRFAPSPRVLEEAIERSFVGTSGRERLGDALAHASWWTDPHAGARWARFARQVSTPDLARVVDDVRASLTPFARPT